MYTVKIKAIGHNVPNVFKVRDTLLSRAVGQTAKTVSSAKNRFDMNATRELVWHSWRGGYRGSAGTFKSSQERIAESRRNGYLNTAQPKYATFVNKNTIHFGFGDKMKIRMLLTRDGTQNLVDLIEYGARPHRIPLTHVSGKTYMAMDNYGKKIMWRKQVDHPGFTGKYFYRDIELFLKRKVGLDIVYLIENFPRFAREVSSGITMGTLSKVISRFYSKMG